MADIIIAILCLVGVIIVIPFSMGLAGLVMMVGNYCDLCPEDLN